MGHVTRNTYHVTRQSGVTLLLSILVVAGLTLIALSVAVFAVQQVRNARAIELTEPAIAAAEAGGERGLWSLKRPNAALGDCNTGTHNTQSLSNNSFIDSCKSFGKATINVPANDVPIEVFLYDPESPNGDIDLLGLNPPYTTLTVNYISGSNPLVVSVTRQDGNIFGISPNNALLSLSNPAQTFTISPVAPGEEGRVKIVLSSSDAATAEVNTNRGMPGFPTIDTTGCNAKAPLTSCDVTGREVFTRRINIVVPQ